MKPVTIKHVSTPGKKSKANEDGIFLKDNLFMVLDGATGLGEKKINIAQSDAQWLVNYVITFFNKNWNSRKSFIKTLEKATKEAKKEFERLTNSKIGLFKTYELPSTGIVAIHLFKNHLKAYRIGDCTLYTNYEYKFNDVFGETPLNSLDGIAINKLNYKLKNGISYDTAREEIKDLLKENRSKMNTKNGYHVLSVNPDSICGFEYKRLKLLKNTEFILASDGFSALYEKYNYSLQKLFNELNNKTPVQLIKDLRDIENNDKELLKYPRLKPHDDASFIFIKT
jgi:serine/threonine protein phosphatase PrpC